MYPTVPSSYSKQPKPQMSTRVSQDFYKHAHDLAFFQRLPEGEVSVCVTTELIYDTPECFEPVNESAQISARTVFHDYVRMLRL